MTTETVTIAGSHGSMVVDASTGVVLKWNHSGDGDYKDIVKIDLDEYRRTYPGPGGIMARIDVLDVGYWDKSGAYEPPAEHWRKEFRQQTQLTA